MENISNKPEGNRVQAWVVDENDRLLYTCPPGNARVMIKNGEAQSVPPKNKNDKQFKIRLLK
jgi:hypothetical protein